MTEGEFADLKPLVYFAAAEKRLGNAMMAHSHCSYEMAYSESLDAVKTVVRLAYHLANKPLHGTVDLSNFAKIAQDLKMAFSEEQFFEVLRDLSGYASKPTTVAGGIQAALSKLQVLLELIRRYVGEATGFQVSWYDRNSSN